MAHALRLFTVLLMSGKEVSSRGITRSAIPQIISFLVGPKCQVGLKGLKSAKDDMLPRWFIESVQTGPE
jgi:hypothetical protein